MLQLNISSSSISYISQYPIQSTISYTGCLKNATHHIIGFLGKCKIPFANLNNVVVGQPFGHIGPNFEISTWNTQHTMNVFLRLP